MRRIVFAALAASFVTAAAPQAQAGNWFQDAWHVMKRDYSRNNAWPEPFVHADRKAVYEPFALMVQKGWARQNTLSAQYFEPGTTKLTQAGLLRVQWIMTQAPPEFRAVFVENGTSALESEQRLLAVRGAAEQFVPEGMPVQVFATTNTAAAWSAEEVNSTRVMFRDTAPSPRLPSPTQAGGSN